MTKYRQVDIQDQQQPAGSKRRAAEQNIAKRLHCSLQQGNISRPARALEGGVLAVPTTDVIAQLAALNPTAPKPQARANTVVPLQISRASLQKVIGSLPKALLRGPSGWTCEHIQAVAPGNAQGMDAVLALVSSMLAGELPDWPELRACRLVPLDKWAR
jgi:hypothetical protein